MSEHEQIDRDILSYLAEMMEHFDDWLADNRLKVDWISNDENGTIEVGFKLETQIQTEVGVRTDESRFVTKITAWRVD